MRTLISLKRYYKSKDSFTEWAFDPGPRIPVIKKSTFGNFY